MHQPRTDTIDHDIDCQLRPISQDEAVIILARNIARIFNRAPGQVPHLKEVFCKAFNDESNYLRTQHSSGGPDDYRRRSL
jgi:hypothetical protein